MKLKFKKLYCWKAVVNGQVYKTQYLEEEVFLYQQVNSQKNKNFGSFEFLMCFLQPQHAC